MGIVPITPTPPPVTPTPFWEMFQNIIYWNLGTIMFVIVGFIALIISYFVVKEYMKGNAKKDRQFKDIQVGNFKVIMYRLIGDRYHEIERVKMKITDSKFRYHNKDFTTFDINNIGFSDKKNNYYCYDYDTGAQLKFTKKDMPKNVSIQDVDIYVNRGIIEQLVKGLEDLKQKGIWLYIIVGVVFGVGIGLLIGLGIYPYIMPKPIQAVVSPTPTPHPIVYKIMELLN